MEQLNPFKRRASNSSCSITDNDIPGGLWLLIWAWCATSNSRQNARLDQKHQRMQTEYMRKIAESK